MTPTQPENLTTWRDKMEHWEIHEKKNEVASRIRRKFEIDNEQQKKPETLILNLGVCFLWILEVGAYFYLFK